MHPPAKLLARFWALVNVGTPTSCWLWRGERNHWGYGRFTLNGRKVAAHRWALQTIVGPLPRTIFALHACDNPACCNPAHLRPGTAAENTAQMLARGRHRPLAR